MPLNTEDSALNEILSQLKYDDNNSHGRRTNNLTSQDLVLIAEIVKSQSTPTCALGLSPEQATTLKKALNAWDGAVIMTGRFIMIALLTAIGGFLYWATHAKFMEMVRKVLVVACIMTGIWSLS